MYGALTDEQYLTSTARDAGVMTAVLTRHPLTTPVPSCPGWDLAELGGHLGVIHRWARDSLASDSPPDEGQPPSREELAGWYRDSADALLSALRAARSDDPCWGFGPHPRTVRFWLRRQAHETCIHAWDAANAVGAPPAIAADLAADGLDEVAGMFYPRQIRLGRREPLGVALAFAATDVGRVSVLGEGEPVATVSGSAEQLLLGLWRRRDLAALLADGDVRMDGDTAVAHAVLAEQLTP
ncbi:maleylpyruvate isomerase family mycothiol-dependent enzyme [Angustibacter luteus]|uniref:Maleylpyruvate isomerase family mycothiol-dependent enzyme n=1 Tax=Angustibacter luteus TaxID=658456 RepID=A0ABW1JFE2_9ACTN